MTSRTLGILLLLASALATSARAADPELTKLSFPVRGKPVSALLLKPADARALLVLAHGQVMNMQHPFMEAIAASLAQHHIATLRFNFPYAEAQRQQIDGEPLLVETIAAATKEGEKRRSGLPLLVGGKSAGALMTALALKQKVVPEAAGAVILGFPLHAPDRPSALNAPALDGIEKPILFVEGSNDPLADSKLMAAVVERIGKNASLRVIEGADHSFAPVADSTKSQQQMYEEIGIAVEDFVATLPRAKGG